MAHFCGGFCGRRWSRKKKFSEEGKPKKANKRWSDIFQTSVNSSSDSEEIPETNENERNEMNSKKAEEKSKDDNEPVKKVEKEAKNQAKDKLKKRSSFRKMDKNQKNKSKSDKAEKSVPLSNEPASDAEWQTVQIRLSKRYTKDKTEFVRNEKENNIDETHLNGKDNPAFINTSPVLITNSDARTSQRNNNKNKKNSKDDSPCSQETLPDMNRSPEITKKDPKHDLDSGFVEFDHTEVASSESAIEAPPLAQNLVRFSADLFASEKTLVHTSHSADDSGYNGETGWQSNRISQGNHRNSCHRYIDYVCILEKATELQPANLEMVVVEDYDPPLDWAAKDEVAITKGTTVTAMYSQGGWLFVKRHDDKKGFVPYRSVRILENDKKSNIKYARVNKSCQQNVSKVRFQIGNLEKKEKQVYAANILSHGHTDPLSNELENSYDADVSYSDEENDHSNNEPKRFYYYDDFDLFRDQNVQKREKASMARIISESNICQMEAGARDPVFVQSNLSISLLELQGNFSKDYAGSAVTVICNYKAVNENDISVARNSVVTLLNDEDPDWAWIMREDGEEGFIPKSHFVNLQALNLDPKVPTTYF
ncbi:uncharacterized protein LOC106170139 [Lingula anatina]|uniref:Uncharacterized protein LOC106170139 n=1 Tax=Lingula anatina TaxID=7574 RepID=A0A1S3J6A2_LINAN|nr:uncharacterized protein LOC106170139 [Lingula anatina]XP_013405449.1 uncharacterized protein LOC106170139 [Lingula anatina]|eukprot:XP_013405369.1 uncharacterized protein LOC106170139 [Lingula anatina]